MRSLEIVQISQLLLGGRKVEECLKSKKPHRELSMICLLLLGVWKEIRKACGVSQGITELGAEAGRSGRGLGEKAAPKPPIICSAFMTHPRY